MMDVETLCDAIMRDRSRRVGRLLPLPLWYRLAPAQHRALLALPRVYARSPVDDTPPPPGAHGRLWGVPYLVADDVPAGCVMFTTDYRTWQTLAVEGTG